MLGNETTGFAGTLDLEAARDRVTEISERFGFHVDPDALVEDLPVGVQQRVEIIKALSRDAELLVFDEPTAVLTPQETDELMDIMRQLKRGREGHRLHHPQAPRGPRGRRPDHRHPPRQGRRRGRPQGQQRRARLDDGRPPGRADRPQGRAEARRRRPGRQEPPGHRRRRPPAGRRHQLHRPGRRGPRRGRRPGQRPDRAHRGARRPPGPRAAARSPSTASSWSASSVRQILDSGVGFIPEDRQVDGLVPSFTIAENLMLNRSFKSPFVKNGSLRIGALREFAQEKLQQYDVRARDIDTLAGNLSGGNQQKVVVARELSRDLRLLVAAQPTRGVDVGSIEFIHKQIVATRDSGIPVLVVSTELDEVVALADRIMVLYRGQGRRHRPGRHAPPDPRTDDDRRTPEGPEGRSRMNDKDLPQPDEKPDDGARDRGRLGPADRRRRRPGTPEAPLDAAGDRRRRRAGRRARGVPGRLRRLGDDRRHRRGRAQRRELHHRAAGRLLLRPVGGHLRRLQRDVPGRDLQLQARRPRRSSGAR